MAIVLGAAVFFWWKRPLQPAGQTEAAYVDSKLCAGCHAEIAKTYRATGMARSFYRPSPTTDMEDYAHAQFFHSPSGTYYEMVRRDGKYFQRSYQLGYRGAQTNIVEKQIDYVMGSGNHVRTYLHRTSRNVLVELPLAWYAENGGAWGMNPGYDRPDHQAARRRISYDCMFCHNAYPQIPAGSKQPSSEPVFSGDLPEGIDCQRCHGPGKAHVDAATRQGFASPQGPRTEPLRRLIVNPARLSADRQFEVCMQCHLETTSFRLPNSVVRYDRHPFSYVPGEPLENFQLFFDHAPNTGHDDKFEIVNSVYRLRQSACFLKSAGKLSCTTCHNPHSIPRAEQAATHYAAVCRQCHGSAHAPSPDCVSCHMPKRRAEDVVHAVMTDHKIQRRPPANATAGIAERHEDAGHTYKGSVVPYHPKPLPATAENELYLAVVQVVQQSNLAAGVSQLAAAIEKHKPARAEFYLQLADAQRAAGDPGSATRLYDAALAHDPNFLPALLKAGRAAREDHQSVRAVPYLEKAAALKADNPEAWHELGLIYLDLNQRDKAQQSFQRAASLDPDFPEAHNSLGGILAESGDRSRAEQAFRAAIRAQPDYAEAHNNLAGLLMLSGDSAQAQYEFEQAIRWKPGYASARFNYASALAAQRRFAEAQVQVEAAIKADQTLPDAHELLASLLVAKGQLEPAKKSYLEALRIRPSFHRAHLGLGAVLAATGDGQGAQTHLSQAAASPDAAVRQEASELLKQIQR